MSFCPLGALEVCPGSEFEALPRSEVEGLAEPVEEAIGLVPELLGGHSQHDGAGLGGEIIVANDVGVPSSDLHMPDTVDLHHHETAGRAGELCVRVAMTTADTVTVLQSWRWKPSFRALLTELQFRVRLHTLRGLIEQASHELPTPKVHPHPERSLHVADPHDALLQG